MPKKKSEGTTSTELVPVPQGVPEQILNSDGSSRSALRGSDGKFQAKKRRDLTHHDSEFRNIGRDFLFGDDEESEEAKTEGVEDPVTHKIKATKKGKKRILKLFEELYKGSLNASSSDGKSAAAGAKCAEVLAHWSGIARRNKEDDELASAENANQKGIVVNLSLPPIMNPEVRQFQPKTAPKKATDVDFLPAEVVSTNPPKV